MELRRLGVICLLSGSVIAMTSGRADATSFTYTFDSGAQGWTEISGSPATPLTWNSSGGNPGGNVSDSASGGISGIGPAWITLGIERAVSLDPATYGATLSLDTALLVNNHLVNAQGIRVTLAGVVNGGFVSFTNFSNVDLLSGAWTSSSVRLDTSTSWVFNFSSGGFDDTHLATQADWNAYLPYLNDLVILNQFSYLRQTGGNGTFGFDNINLTEAAPPSVPEPTSMLLLGTGLAGLGLRQRRR